MALTYQVAGFTLSDLAPTISDDNLQYVFTLNQVVTHIKECSFEGKFEQIDSNIKFNLDISGFDPFALGANAAKAAESFVNETYNKQQ